jgi:pyridoxal phosphate enzyme (YggS family)
VTDLGENWVQEALPKRPAVEQLEPRRVRWHMIGHLQTNKVKKALNVFDIVQGVDSLHLAQELDRRAAQSDRVLPILLEVNTSGEASKFGIAPEGLPALGEAVRGLAHIRLDGLMTIGPGLSVEDPEKSRPCFQLLRDLSDRLGRELGLKLPVLSMGMSSDFAVAIAEGTTMLRIGTAIFGAR